MKELVRTVAAGATGAVIASVAIAGAPAVADQVAKAAPKNSVTSKSIKNGAVKPADLAASVKASLAKADSALQAIPDNGVTNPKLADNAVGSPEVATDSLTQSDLANNSVGNGEIIGNSVTGAKVSNGTLTMDDIAAASGNVNYNPPSLGAGACTTNLIETNTTNIGDFVYVQPDFLIDNALSFSARVSAADTSQILVFVCNETGGTVDSAQGGLYWWLMEG
ncbi:hypothetical protein [Nocardioides sp.]|uniref:hypothetical protein n=1 Tax=Nocardioides sp. TaxID=35761 RepID=UPI001A199E46|nr:hypothetical protein [Nocardioides sp.]MBJ7356609.1 hypothetical protein [Nocardioides sp.]